MLPVPRKFTTYSPIRISVVTKIFGAFIMGNVNGLILSTGRDSVYG